MSVIWQKPSVTGRRKEKLMYSDKQTLCFLQSVQGIGSKTIENLWSYFKTGERIFHADEEELKKLLGERQRKAFLDAREKTDPKEVLQKLEQRGISYCTVFDWNYPSRLRKVSDAPLSLYVRGSLPPEDCMTASVIGARKHSYYGEKQTKLFAKILAQEQVGVVSGMAKGIDSIAQMTALENGGTTYAVLGCGVDVCYPPECRRLYEKLSLQGGIISEYPPGTQPKAGLFPLRNRIISALGDILLVMEARMRSGTLITVDMALEQGKEIWALPGRCDDVLSYGCNRLIAQGAGILTGEKEFCEELNILKYKYGRKTPELRVLGKENAKRKKAASDISGNAFENQRTDGQEILKAHEATHSVELEQEVLNVLDYQPVSLNEIYKCICRKRKTDIELPQISEALVGLCVKGLAKQVNGSWYIRV